MADAPLEGVEAWSALITFTGPSEQAKAWVQENFPTDIQSEAYKDDMASVVQQLGPGVQQKDDHITEGVEASIALLVVVGR